MKEFKMKSGFTLVELLVVISIIALLLSLLMPALNKTKEQARFVICKSQLHQIGMGAIAYSSDNSGRLPPGDHVDGLVIVKHAESSGLLPSGPRNLGHLLEKNYIALPKDSGCILWCPTAKAVMTDRKLSGFGRVFTVDYFMNLWSKRYNLPAEAASTLFTAYNYRASMDGRNNVDLQKGVSASLIGKNAIVMDSPLLKWYIWGYTGKASFSFHPSGSDSKYNILMGDGSVQFLNDADGKWMTAYILRYPSAKKSRCAIAGDAAPISWRDYDFFDVVDQYFGAPAFRPPAEKSTWGW